MQMAPLVFCHLFEVSPLCFYVSLCLSLCLCLCMFLTVCLSLSLYASHFVCLSVCLSLSLCVEGSRDTGKPVTSGSVSKIFVLENTPVVCVSRSNLADAVAGSYGHRQPDFLNRQTADSEQSTVNQMDVSYVPPHVLVLRMKTYSDCTLH